MFNRKGLPPQIFWFCLIVFVLGVPRAGAAFRYLHEGMAVPAFKGEDIVSGEQIESTALGRGNIVVVVFWSTWSPRSLEELKDLKELASRFADKSVQFLAVNVDGQSLTSRDRNAIRGLVTGLELPFPVILDNRLEIFYRFGVIAVPSTAILDTTGVLRYGPAGYSLSTRDFIVDSIGVLLGLHPPGRSVQTKRGYEPNNTASRYYQLAVNLVVQRMYERALDNLNRAVVADSGFPSPFCLRGEVYIKLDSLERARTAFQQALLRDSTLVQAWSGLGKALRIAGLTDSALEVLSHALSLDSIYTPALLSYGLTLAESGKSDEAIDTLSSTLGLNPRDPVALYYLARTGRLAKRRAEAAKWYLKALEIWYPAP